MLINVMLINKKTCMLKLDCFWMVTWGVIFWNAISNTKN